MNYYKRMKIALRGNIPKMEDWDTKDPYKKHNIGDGQGYDMTRPGDEDGWSGFGTRVRGKNFPTDIQEKDDYDLQREKDIPVSNHMFIGGDEDLQPVTPGDTGVDNGEFFDSDSPLSRERIVSDKLENNFSNPSGPHNMNGGGRVGLYHKLRNRIR